VSNLISNSVFFLSRQNEHNSAANDPATQDKAKSFGALLTNCCLSVKNKMETRMTTDGGSDLGMCSDSELFFILTSTWKGRWQQ